MNNSPPPVSVVIPTRNGGDKPARVVRSILSCDYPDLELIVVDQSTDERTADALRPFVQENRLRHLRTTTTGAGRARNIGIDVARHDIVLLTDDDCEVATNWVSTLVSIFALYPEVTLVFVNVLPPLERPPDTDVTSYRRTGDLLITNLRGYRKLNPLGAGMSVRKSIVQAIGGIDEHMGTGAPIMAHEEDDLMLRCLLQGKPVYETDRTFVIHHGYKTFAEMKQITFRNYFGTGGGCAKFVKCGQWRVLPFYLYVCRTTIVVPFFIHLARLEKPRIVSRVTGFVCGFGTGMRTPVDRHTMLFKPRPVALPTRQPQEG